METCKWTIYNNEIGRWDTECGKQHFVHHGFTPVQESIKFCPYCSKPIQQKTNGFIPHYDHYNREHRILAERYGT